MDGSKKSFVCVFTVYMYFSTKIVSFKPIVIDIKFVLEVSQSIRLINVQLFIKFDIITARVNLKKRISMDAIKDKDN